MDAGKLLKAFKPNRFGGGPGNEGAEGGGGHHGDMGERADGIGLVLRCREIS